ncbi:unnamed protein product [Symbiodinium sp. KB8]|nr:unnamed protein product [Symbiodinium sp. KB8]
MYIDRLLHLEMDVEGTAEQLTKTRESVIDDVMLLMGYSYLCPNRIIAMAIDIYERIIIEEAGMGTVVWQRALASQGTAAASLGADARSHFIAVEGIREMNMEDRTAIMEFVALTTHMNGLFPARAAAAAEPTWAGQVQWNAPSPSTRTDEGVSGSVFLDAPSSTPTPMKPPTASGKGRDSPGASAPDYTDGEVPDPPPTKVSSQAASRITWDLIGRAQGHREVDRPAIQVADFNIPGIHHRGDFTEDTPKQCMVIFMDGAAGRHGNRGYPFNMTAQFIGELRMITRGAWESWWRMSRSHQQTRSGDEITHDPKTGERWTWSLLAAPDSFDAASSSPTR